MASGPGSLRIQLMGGFSVSVGDRAVEEGVWRLRKARTLLKLVALTPGHALHRDQVIEMLWPDRDAAAAANNLRQALFLARRAIDSCGGDGAAWLDLSQELVSVTPAAEASVDVEEFEAAADEAERLGDVEAYRAAVELYTGDLLPEDRFEEWAGGPREVLRERHLGLLMEVAALEEAAGDRAAAVAALQRVVVADPMHERAHRELMRLYALAGRRQRALSQYHALRETLDREVADEPEAETRRLYQDMLARRDGGEQAEPFIPGRTGPAPARAVAHPNNLPLQLTSFVGRERQLDDVGGLLARRRLVTLTGAGGSGKTRLALEVAKRAVPQFEDGVWLVELGSLSDSAQVAHATAVAVGAESRSRRPSEESIADHIGERSLLIVLDNCEHLVDACASLAGALLSRCPHIKLLATSREPLGIQGEVDARVPSLMLPAPDVEFSVAELREFESVRLFAERAASAQPPFELTEATAPGVAEICRRVDGMPLALELAAARVAVLSVDDIAERLQGSLSLLAGGSRTALSRQQTLTATIDWSHDLLDDSERVLFRRLGVFAGGVGLAAVEEVCAGGPIVSAEVLDLLGALVSKSLVLSERAAGESRFRLLVPLRQYARERLDEAGEREPLEGRHRRYFLELAEAIEPGLVAVDPAPALARLDVEYDDLRAALRRALGSDPRQALRLAISLWRYWLSRSRFAEGGEWLRAALERTAEPSSLRTRALTGACILGIRQGENVAGQAALAESIESGPAAGDDLASAEALQLVGALDFIYAPASDGLARLERSRRLAVSLGSSSLRAAALHTLAIRADFQGNRPRAAELLEESLALLRGIPEEEALTIPLVLGILVTAEGPGRSPRVLLEDTVVQARRVRASQAVGDVLTTLGSVHRNAGRLELARERLDEALVRFRDLGDTVGAAIALGQLGNLLRLTGDHETARELLEECLALREQIGDRRGTGLALGNLGLLAARTGDWGRARELIGRARQGFLAAGDKPGEAHVEMNLGHVATDEGKLGEARQQLERAKRIWSDLLDMERVAAWLDASLVAISRQEGDEERARRHIAQAAAVFESVGDAAGTAWCEKQSVAVEDPANGPLTGR